MACGRRQQLDSGITVFQGMSDFLVLCPAFDEREYLCPKDELIDTVLEIVLAIENLDRGAKELTPAGARRNAVLICRDNADSLVPVASNQSGQSQLSIQSHVNNFRVSIGVFPELTPVLWGENCQYSQVQGIDAESNVSEAQDARGNWFVL